MLCAGHESNQGFVPTKSTTLCLMLAMILYQGLTSAHTLELKHGPPIQTPLTFLKSINQSINTYARTPAEIIKAFRDNVKRDHLVKITATLLVSIL